MKNASLALPASNIFKICQSPIPAQTASVPCRICNEREALFPIVDDQAYVIVTERGFCRECAPAQKSLWQEQEQRETRFEAEHQEAELDLSLFEHQIAQQTIQLEGETLIAILHEEEIAFLDIAEDQKSMFQEDEAKGSCDFAFQAYMRRSMLMNRFGDAMEENERYASIFANGIS